MRRGNRLWPPRGDVGSDNGDVRVGRAESLAGILLGYESRFNIEREISLSPETVKDRKESRVLLVNSRPDEFDDGDVTPGLAPGAESITEHKRQGRFQHRFVGLLQARLFVDGEEEGDPSAWVWWV